MIGASHGNTREVPSASASIQRLFIIGGMLLILSGMLFGDIYAVFILHPNITRIGAEMSSVVQAVAAQDPESVFTHFRAVGGFLENAGTKKDAHVHIIQLGYLALLLGFVQPYVALTSRVKMRLAKLFLVGAVGLPVCVFLIHYVGLVYSPLQSIGWASIFADVAGLVLIIVCVAELVGLWRYIRGDRGSAQLDKVVDTQSWESRVLLAGGTLMLLGGFVYGAYYAGMHLDAHEARELSTLRSVMDSAVANDTAGAGTALGEYGALQGEKAVMIAAHAHIGEFGLLALLLAVVQPYVFLRRRWRRRLVVILLSGSVLLPIAVYAEQWFGLVAGGIADIGGLLVIIAVMGMLGGVLRDTGRTDATSGETT